MFENKIYLLTGTPVSRISLWIFFGIMGLFTVIVIYTMFIQSDIFSLFGFRDINSEKLKEESAIITLTIFITTVPLSMGPMVWFAGHILSLTITKQLFQIQRISLLHFIISKKMIPVEDIFILKNIGKWYESSVIVFVGTWSLSFILSKAVLPYVSTTNIEGISGWDIILFASVLTMGSFIIIVPITIIYSSNIRLKLKNKNLVTSGFSIYKYVILSFLSVNIIFSTISSLKYEEPIALINYVFFVPSISVTILYSIFSHKLLTEEFRRRLKNIGIKEDSI